MHVNIDDLERDIIQVVSKTLGAGDDSLRGYITSGGTEANFACLLWLKTYLFGKLSHHGAQLNSAVNSENNEKEDFLRAKLKLHEVKRPILYTAEKHTHYSIPKACEFFNFDLCEVKPTEKGEMDLSDFRAKIQTHVKEFPHRGGIINANFPSTVFGGIDDVKRLKEILDQETENGKLASFAIHVDGALLGLVISIITGYKNIFSEEIGGY